LRYTFLTPGRSFCQLIGFNERFKELNNHPERSFHGRDFPSNTELLEARNRVLARHPKTQFILLHVGNDAENLSYVSECLDCFPNASVELGARIGELGRRQRMSRKFFDRYQDRIFLEPMPRRTERNILRKVTTIMRQPCWT